MINCVLDNPGDADEAVVNVDGTLSMTHCLVTSNTKNGVLAQRGRVSVDKCTVDAYQNGITVRNATAFTARGSTFSGAAQRGLDVDATANVEVVDCAFSAGRRGTGTGTGMVVHGPAQHGAGHQIRLRGVACHDLAVGVHIACAKAIDVANISAQRCGVGVKLAHCTGQVCDVVLQNDATGLELLRCLLHMSKATIHRSAVGIDATQCDLTSKHITVEASNDAALVFSRSSTARLEECRITATPLAMRLRDHTHVVAWMRDLGGVVKLTDADYTSTMGATVPTGWREQSQR
jgi:hypothetical protein